ncbi:MAG: RNA polymerase sigma factor [Tepidisphaeraceae bacterium]|jgi:RNA polymerase sigma-70 factor (ECF subfamily)
MDTELSPDITTPVRRSDEELVRRLRASDGAAGDELVMRHGPALLRYLRRLVRSDHLAEELHQQTWTSIVEHLDRFDISSAGGGFKAWLYRIATNKANDHWRSLGREKKAKEGLRLIGDEMMPDASFRAVSTEQQEKLRKAIDTLPEHQKQVLMLRYYGNLKFIEIAQMLGCPLNTALGRMHKAMLHLKQVMS